MRKGGEVRVIFSAFLLQNLTLFSIKIMVLTAPDD